MAWKSTMTGLGFSRTLFLKSGSSWILKMFDSNDLLRLMFLFISVHVASLLGSSSRAELKCFKANGLEIFKNDLFEFWIIKSIKFLFVVNFFNWFILFWTKILVLILWWKDNNLKLSSFFIIICNFNNASFQIQDSYWLHS